MSIYTAINLTNEGHAPHGMVLSLDTGDLFLSFGPHPAVSIILDGNNLDAAVHARSVAAKLIELANELEAQLDVRSHHAEAMSR